MKAEKKLGRKQKKKNISRENQILLNEIGIIM